MSQVIWYGHLMLSDVFPYKVIPDIDFNDEGPVPFVNIL